MTVIEDDARSIFLGVLEHAPDQWPAFLVEACGDNAELRARVEQLLDAHQAMGSIHGAGAGESVATVDEQPITEGPGTVIGSYKLLEQIGEGGFGIVFMAEQHQPMRRKVALKVLKPGMDTRQVVARFEAERQALALMDHPNIAHVFDGGKTTSGRPYFVMELVRGIPITDFCDQNHLSIRERLELFTSVCRAVQHAHQKGVIHRDLKPSNVMVTMHDNVPVVKVIDFGIAKAMGQQLTEKTLFTNFAQMIGTPVYMSPEQAQMSGLDIDTRTDIYSLGVLLYELLTGTTPFDKERLGTAAYDEIRRIIREEEPPRPSKRISTLATLECGGLTPLLPGSAASDRRNGEDRQSGCAAKERESGVKPPHSKSVKTIAAQRSVEPRMLSQLVRGELDWIVMKALEKDRNRRYETASALAADVQRHLHDQTVLACPPTLGYRLRKSVRRHKGPVLAATLVALALVGGIIGTTWGLIRATYAEADAVTEANEKEIALKEKETALSDAQDKLFLSLVNQARAERIGGRVGQRFEALKAIREAAQIRMTSELRTEAIAALILPDVELAVEWEGWPEGSILLAFDATFERYARLDKQGVITICRLSNGREEVITRLTAPGGPFYAVWLSPDGRFVACGHSRLQEGVFGGVGVWKLDGPSPVVQLDVPEGVRGIALAFRPNGRQLAIGHADKAVSIYDLVTGECVQRLAKDSTAIHLAFHPRDSRVALARLNGGVELFDVETGTKLQAPQVPSGHSVAWHPDGRRLAIGGYDRKIHLWDTETGAAVMAPWVGHSYDGVRVGFNHGGDRLLSVDWAGGTRLWDVATGRTLLTMPGNFGLQVSSDDRLLGHEVSGTKIRLWRLAGGQELRVLRGRNAVSSDVIHNPVVHANGRTLAAATSQGLSFFELATGEELASVRLPQPYAGCPVFFHPAKPSPTIDERGEGEGSAGWMTGGTSGLLLWPARPDPARQRVLRVGPPQPVIPEPGSNFASGTSASADGRVVAVPQGGSTIVLHCDRPDQRVVLGPQYDVRFSAVSPDGHLVVTCSHFEDQRSKSARIWNADTGEQLHELPLEGFTEAKFSPDGRWLMTISRGGCRLWEVSTWHEVRRFDTSYGYFAFSPDSQILAISDVFSVIRLVETATGRELARLTGPEPMWYAPRSFAPDGTRLVATCSGEKALYVWDLRLIRQQLKQIGLGLDWDWPDFAPVDSTGQASEPIAVEVQLGDAALPVPTREQKAAKNIERYRRAIAANPESAKDSNNLAWLYLTAPESLRDVNAALPLAEKAVSLAADARQLAMHRNTLGVAYYRAARYREAVEILRTNVTSQEDSALAFDLYFLAMSHDKLGESARARDYYDWAVRWVAAQRNLSAAYAEELTEIRAEAEEVLGVKEN